MNRKERRALAHQQRKLERKQAKLQPATATTATPVAAAVPQPKSPIADDAILGAATAFEIPEPGGLFPSLDAITPAPSRPVSAAQLAANRANAQRSTGPRTPIGVAVTSQNRTTHGLARHNGAFRLLSSEDPNGFEALKALLASEHQPETETESILINTMAESHWLANRALKLQDTCTCPDTGAVTNEKLFSLYMRYHSTHFRAFNKSLNDLIKLRKEKRVEQNGFDAQNRKAEELRIKSEQHEMKKQGHFWDVLFKDAKANYQLIRNMNAKDEAAKENPGFEAQYAAELANLGLKEHRAPVVAAVAA